MAYTPTPVDRAGDALRQLTSLVIAAQLIASGSRLPSERETAHLVIDLLYIAEVLGKLGREAMAEIEAALARSKYPTMTA